MSTNLVQSELLGNVKLGQGCVIGPNCQIVSEVGEMIIGDYTIIEDGCFIRNNQLKKMMIGSFNHFEINCRIENSVIGDNNVFEIKSIYTANQLWLSLALLQETIVDLDAHRKYHLSLRLLTSLGSIIPSISLEFKNMIQKHIEKKFKSFHRLQCNQLWWTRQRKTK